MRTILVNGLYVLAALHCVSVVVSFWWRKYQQKQMRRMSDVVEIVMWDARAPLTHSELCDRAARYVKHRRFDRQFELVIVGLSRRGVLTWSRNQEGTLMYSYGGRGTLPLRLVS
jgi:hypothetical protein